MVQGHQQHMLHSRCAPYASNSPSKIKGIMVGAMEWAGLVTVLKRFNSLILFKEKFVLEAHGPQKH